jgi:hypothetical protein
VDHTNLISRDSRFQCFITFGIQIIRIDENTLFPCWNSKRSDSSHNVTNYFSRLKYFNQSLVFSLKTSVPVHFRIVEFENTVAFAKFNVHVIWTGKNFIVERSEFGGCAYTVDFVDDGCDFGVLVYNYLCDDFLVR